jgi:hypothetical protein
MMDRSEVVWVALNRGDGVRAAAGLPDGPLRDLRSGETVDAGVQLAPRSSRILVRP